MLMTLQEEEQELEAGKLSGLPKDAGNALEIQATLHRGLSKQTGLLIGQAHTFQREPLSVIVWPVQCKEEAADCMFVLTV